MLLMFSEGRIASVLIVISMGGTHQKKFTLAFDYM